MLNNKGDRAMNLGVKGAGIAVVFGISYINHIFSPLIWALLALIVIDVLLNVHKEGEQFNKIGSAFMTLGGTSVVNLVAILLPKSTPFTTETIHGIVAVMVLAYAQVVSPQIVGIIKKVKFLAPAAKEEMIAAILAENEALKQVAAAQANKENKVVVTAGEQK